MIEENREGDAFIGRVSSALRPTPQADEAFVERVMATVEATGPSQSRNWWLRPRTFRVSPLATLAMAAGVALAAVGVGQLATRSGDRVPAATAASDTVYLVRFVFNDSAAQTVALVGTFNDWTKSATPMTQSAPGLWTVTLPLHHGRHEYAFVVRDARGERWGADPAAVLRRDEFGTESSIVSVGTS
jgi:predicted carbohydrate-binding protein with CBM48